jgi:hypothetical protein
MKTKLYRALTGLAYPTNQNIIDRLAKGEDIPWEERGIKEVAIGDIVDDIPVNSLRWLIDQGCIELYVPPKEVTNGE